MNFYVLIILYQEPTRARPRPWAYPPDPQPPRERAPRPRKPPSPQWSGEGGQLAQRAPQCARSARQ